MILNTPPQVGAYRSYALSLLHMYLTGEGSLERVCKRGFVKEDPSEKVRWRRSVGTRSGGEDLSEKTRRRRPVGEDSTQKVRRRRFDGEGLP